MDLQEQEMREALAASKAAALRREGNLLAITLKGDLTFDTNSSVIKFRAEKEIDRVGSVLLRYTQTIIQVEGHTDSVGSEEYNIRLSRRRAQAVKNILIQKGVKSSRIEIIAFGESRPRADNSTKEGRLFNRRVEIKVAPISSS